MSFRVTEHERIRLRELPEFSEAWLHEYISNHTAILGLGELEVLDRERIQQSAGRLDMLLSDSEDELRYEVEIMLGATDPSHIIRCIEYWDIERRRYPAYDHVAVLVAEEVTSRFLNVMSLLAGSIPLVAIQLNALKVGDQIVLDFVKVLDQRALREDEPQDSATETADRETWERRVGGEILKLCDRIAEIANEVAEPKLELKYQKSRVALCPHGSFFNVAASFPKKGFLTIRMRVTDSDAFLKRLEEAGIETRSRKPGSIIVRLRPADVREQEAVLRELIHQAVREF
jgi:hypothetical protein